MRLSWDRYYMNIAIETSKRSTCDRLSVGCVIVKNNRIISTGYNGSVSGFDHCIESGHLFNKEGRCIRTVHAEQNAILFAGENLSGATCYVTHYPCEHCSKLLAQAGISRLVYGKEYMNEHSMYFLKNIDVCKIEEE
jgi:dCMP deaminase